MAARFALVGAAAFSASVCRSFSLAVAIFELAPVEALLIPISLTTIVAIMVANGLGPSIFDNIIASKQLPAPLQFRDFGSSLRSVRYMMRTDFATVPQYAKLKDIEEALDKWPDEDTAFFAVVHRSVLGDSGVVKERLVGVISRDHLYAALDWLEAPKRGQERKTTATIRVDNNGLLVEQMRQGAEAEDLVFDLTSRVPGERKFEAVQPLTVPPTTTLENLAVLFVMNQCEVAWVTGQHGEVLGIITEQEIKEECKQSGREMSCSRWFSKIVSL